MSRTLYSNNMKLHLLSLQNLSIKESVAKELIIENKSIKGIIDDKNNEYLSNHVILTTGTFLNGKVYISNKTEEGGRYYKNTLEPEPAISNITKQLKSYGFDIKELKTGTPPRIDINTINFDGLEIQESDDKPTPLSFLNIYNNVELPNKNDFIKCYKTNTNEKTHDIIRKHLNELPQYISNNGSGIGPRYCPSIDKKILMFPDRKSHIIWLEPEDIKDYLYSNSVYPNGISIAMKESTQLEMLHTIKGLENCKIIRPGYAVEYSFLNPLDLYHTLESKLLKGLYLAGQINGTTGYEEAAGQGIIAGINASLDVLNKPKLNLDRNNSIIGVMIDDLITNGTNEPYRMFTSRCEYRLLLRPDNADLRLTEIGYKLGCVNEERYRMMKEKEKMLKDYEIELKKHRLPTKSICNYGIQTSQPRTYWELLSKPDVHTDKINEIIKDRKDTNEILLKYSNIIETECKYENYLIKQKNEIESLNRQKKLIIPKDINYHSILGVSNEEIEKLSRIKPETVYEASRISGIRPHTLLVIINYCHNKNKIN